MPLRISRQIETRPQKIGRNNPCYCGSGKKYKKCCLKIEEQYSPPIHKGQISRLVDWVAEQSFFKDILQNKLQKFFGANVVEEHQLNGLVEALLFEEKIHNQTPLEHFIEKASLTEQERQMYRRWQDKSFFSIFEVINVNLGKSLRLKRLADGQEYLTFERMGTYQINKGAIIPCRLIPLENFWMMGGGLQTILADSEENYVYKRFFKKPELSQITELKFIEGFYGQQKDGKRKVEELSHNQAKKLLSDLLKKEQISYQINNLEATILENNLGQNRIIEELAQKAHNNEELNNWIELLHHYWHTHPKFKDKMNLPGPKEKILVDQMMLEFREKNLDKLPVEKINKVADEFCKQWFITPQKELEGKTPKEVIIKEREARGNNNKELTYQLSFSPLKTSFSYNELTKKYNLATRLQAKDRQYLKALELFAEMASEIDFLETEQFRWYGKVATCLIQLGQIELGKKYLEKSLELNHNYDTALKNMETINSVQDLQRKKEMGEQELFYSVLEKQPIFTLGGTNKPGTCECELLQDIIGFLSYLNQNTVPLSQKQRVIRFNDVLAMNRKLIRPDREAVKIGKSAYSYSAEWQMPKIKFLHLITGVGKLSKDDRKRLILTPAGKEFLTKNREEQFSQIFAIWFAKLDWASIEDNVSRINFLKPLMQTLQSQSWLILKTLKEFEQKKFTKKEFLDNALKLKKDKAQDFIPLFIDGFLEQLSWAGLIKADEKSKIKDELEPFGGLDVFFTTPFGLKLIKAIQNQMDNAIPEILKK